MPTNLTKLIIGLGNPGAKYETTRHNIGFKILDALAAKYAVKFKKETKFRAEVAIYSTEAGTKLILAKPLTFMNESGDAVSRLMKFYKIPPEQVLVVQDDVSMDTAKLRLAVNRGAGGQHGIEDIMLKLGGLKSFHRIKFGVGPDPGGDMRADYVLSDFPKAQTEILNTAIKETLSMIETWVLA